MDKSPEAFRTISEVAETLETPAHVLRFWESRFPQIRPVKRAGGRRYYRPADVALLSGIKHLLHDEGMTIRGVQKILREQGVRHVAALASAEGMAETDLVLDEADFPAAEDVGAEIVELDHAAPRAPQTPSGPLGEVLRLHPAAPPRATGPEADDLDLASVFAPPPADSAGPAPAATATEAAAPAQPELDLAPPLPLFSAAPDEAPARAAPPAPQPPRAPARTEPQVEGLFEGLFLDQAPAPAPAKLAGLAARIRALPRPLSPIARVELEDLHNRLGLLHAQMAEAMRNRR